MTQVEIAKDIAAKTKLKPSDVNTVINYYVNAVIDEIVADGKFTITNFGAFAVKGREARSGRNPKTGEPIEIAAHNTVTFKAAKSLVSVVQDFVE